MAHGAIGLHALGPYGSIGLRARGTDVAYDATRTVVSACSKATQPLHPTPRYRPLYAMSGTDLPVPRVGMDLRARYAMPGTDLPRRPPIAYRLSPIVLGLRYAMFGTAIGHAATVLRHVRTDLDRSGGDAQLPTRPLREVRRCNVPVAARVTELTVRQRGGSGAGHGSGQTAHVGRP
eukprot:3145967-Rhodomonas_salina.1